MKTRAGMEPDFRAPTASKRIPRAVADAGAGIIIAVAEVGGPPERAFDALTTNEVERWWKFPGNYHQKDWQADLRVCGAWSVTVELADASLVHAWGEFCALDFPNRIVMTRRFDAHPFLGDRETTITYHFEPTPVGTLITVRDEGFIGRAQAAYGNADIWEHVLGWLDAYLTAGSTEMSAGSAAGEPAGSATPKNLDTTA
ncbi:MAG: SRPBCC family protein [Gemmatimonadaceae bacterium]